MEDSDALSRLYGVAARTTAQVGGTDVQFWHFVDRFEISKPLASSGVSKTSSGDFLRSWRRQERREVAVPAEGLVAGL